MLVAAFSGVTKAGVIRCGRPNRWCHLFTSESAFLVIVVKSDDIL